MYIAPGPVTIEQYDCLNIENLGLRMKSVLIKLVAVVGMGSQPRIYPSTVIISLLSVTLERSAESLNRITGQAASHLRSWSRFYDLE